ncbi:hypothetical protein BDV95DRAFT_628593 [Massariosphaeria phaeospora]|uniref:Uncharacterized protein n=1 Tax=Massariosphaeria phaeospora TaxID=100035 RepID=A0A7C8MFQ9_9PLEO|nr:hypothetical protein BDV95DRAFT_628593 [Massariosphaeria phaeospora]
MGLLSILPENLNVVETWLTRLFLLLAFVTLGPWAFLLVYDLVLYLARSITYEIPVVGGRAQGKARPRAPSLTERPSGHRRRFSLARHHEGPARSTGGLKSDEPEPRWRHIPEETADGFAST